MKFWMNYVWVFKSSWSFLLIKKSYSLLQKLNKFKNSWVPTNTHGYFNTTGTHIMGIHEGTGRAWVLYLSNGTGTGIILSVFMGTHWHSYTKDINPHYTLDPLMVEFVHFITRNNSIYLYVKVISSEN